MTIPWSVENKANRIGHPLVLMLHPVAVHDVPGLVARQLLSQVVYRYIVVGLVQDHHLFLTVYFDWKWEMELKRPPLLSK